MWHFSEFAALAGSKKLVPLTSGALKPGPVINLSYLERTSTFKENEHRHFSSFISLLKYFAGLNHINVWVVLRIYLSRLAGSCMTPLATPSLTPTRSLCGSRFAKTDSSLAAALGYSFPNSLQSVDTSLMFFFFFFFRNFNRTISTLTLLHLGRLKVKRLLG